MAGLYSVVTGVVWVSENGWWWWQGPRPPPACVCVCVCVCVGLSMTLRGSLRLQSPLCGGISVRQSLSVSVSPVSVSPVCVCVCVCLRLSSSSLVLFRQTEFCLEITVIVGWALK